jgi:hypothetical protein
LDTSERQRFSDVVGVCSPGVSSLHSGHATIPFFPKIMLKNGIKIPQQSIQNSAGEVFDEKVRGFFHDTAINPGTNNVKSKLHYRSKFFLDRNSVTDCIKSLKIKIKQ